KGLLPILCLVGGKFIGRGDPDPLNWNFKSFFRAASLRRGAFSGGAFKRNPQEDQQTRAEQPQPACSSYLYPQPPIANWVTSSQPPHSLRHALLSEEF